MTHFSPPAGGQVAPCEDELDLRFYPGTLEDHMATQTTETFEGYCIIEVMGRRRLAGFVREVTIAGAGFLRVDVPGDGDATVMTQYIPPASIYAITPTTEEIARAVAKRTPEGPVTRWELPPPAVTVQRTLPGELPPEAYQEHDPEFEYDDSDDDDDIEEEHHFPTEAF